MAEKPKQLQYSQITKLAKAKAREYDITSSFPLGYRNREDVTNMIVADSTGKLTYTPSVLVKGSQNVLTNIGERIGIRKGYELYGQANTANGGITAAYDWVDLNNERHVRLNSNTGNLELAIPAGIVPGVSTVKWAVFATGFTANPNFNFAPLFNTSEEIPSLLMVNGTSNIYDWSGGVALSSTASATTGFVETAQLSPNFAFASGQGYSVNDILTIANVGGIDAMTKSAAGSGYSSGDIGTVVGGGGTGATFKILSVGTGIASYAINNSGSGYTVGDNLSVSGGSGGFVQVTEIDGGSMGGPGAITNLVLTSGGSGYSAGTENLVGGSGASATLTITVGSGSGINTVQILQSGTGYTFALGTGIAVATPHSGPTGSGYNVGDVLTVGAPGTGGTLTVATLSGSSVASVTITTPGTSYSTASNQPTTGGSGTGASFDITSGVTFTTLLGGSGGYINYLTGQPFGNNDATMTVTSTDPSTGAITGLTLTTPGTGYVMTDGYTATGGTGGGAVLDVTSVTDNSLTVAGSETVAELGFYVLNTTAGKSLYINGASYTYSSAVGQTFLGVSPTPVAIPANSLIIQGLVVTPNSSIAGLPSNYPNDLIGNLNEQIFLGSFTTNYVYVSRSNTYRDFTFNSVREPGDGAKKTLQGNTVAFMQLEGDMYMSSGQDFWYKTQFTPSSTTVTIGSTAVNFQLETLDFIQLKTSPRQGAQNQNCISKLQNQMIYMSYEPAFNTFGIVTNILEVTQIASMSDSIKLDLDLYDFTDCATIYYRNFIYVAIPAEGVVRVYNIARGYWEAPQILPIRFFAIIDGELYGHDYNVPQTYKLFTGYTDNGHAINASAVFAFDNLSSRFTLKNENAFYVEGYITENTNLTLNLQYDLDGNATNRNFTLNGGTTPFVAVRADNSSLGKVPYGKNPLGGTTNTTNSETLPPKFRWIPTFTKLDFFEKQVSFSSTGAGQHWELLAFGGNTTISDSEPVYLKQ